MYCNVILINQSRHTVKGFQVLLLNTNNSIQLYSFVCTRLDGSMHLMYSHIIHMHAESCRIMHAESCMQNHAESCMQNMQNHAYACRICRIMHMHAEYAESCICMQNMQNHAESCICMQNHAESCMQNHAESCMQNMRGNDTIKTSDTVV